MAEFDAPPKAPAPDVLLTPMSKVGSTPRTQLARKLADIAVLPAGRVSANERALVADILLQVIGNVDMALRKEIASRIAKLAESPPALVRALLLDEPEVAEAILRGSVTIAEGILIEAAREGVAAHRMMIAARVNLTTATADALLEKGELEVCKAVLKRDDCTLSPNAVNQLVAMSATAPDLHGPLLRRRELEPSHGFIMFWWVDAERRRRILTRFSIDRRIIQDALADLFAEVFQSRNRDPFVEEILTLAERRLRSRNAQGELVSKDVVLRALDDAWRDPSQDHCSAVAAIANVRDELGARIMRDAGGEPFAIICKSVGITRDQFYALVKKPHPPGPAAQDDKSDYLLGVFDSLARDFARAIMRYWDWEGNPRIAHISRLLGLDDAGVKVRAL
jgi:uncharacterized protein (DUF2336 family)